MAIHEAKRKPLNGAVVGLGRMGLTHVAILRTHPEVRGLAVSDASSCLGNAVEKQLGFPFYATAEKLLEKAPPDFMIIATPTRYHTAIARAAMESGVHVFVEKPLSLSAQDSTGLLRLAQSRSIVTQVGYVNRFNEIFQAVRQLVRSGELGPVTHVQCEVRSPMVLKAAKSWRSSAKEGGGCLYDIASHGIDLMNFLVGRPARVFGSSLQSIVSDGLEDCVDAILDYRDFRGSLHVNWSDPSCRKPAYRLNINLTQGRIVADQHAFRVFEAGRCAGRRDPQWTTTYITDIAEPVRMYVRGNEYTRQLDYFIDSVQQARTSGECDFAAALETDQVIEWLRADAKGREL